MMDSRIGLDYIVENRDYISKLGTALDTNNVLVKKQVFELLSALCAYNSDGYARAIDTLEFYKNLKQERYRFKIVTNELEKTTNIEYQVALLAFTNCVIISAATLQDRIRVRNEFIGLKVLPILNNLRKVAQSVGDIIVQLDVFEEQRECDEAQSLQGPNGINLNSHLDVFYAVLRQVADTPQEAPFLSILQHLLRIDSKEAVSDIIWDTTEKLVHRATLLENQEDSERLLRTTAAHKFTCPNCRHDATSPIRKSTALSNSITSSSASGPLSPQATTNKCTPPPPPPPAPPIPPPPQFGISTGAPPPPPPPMNMGKGPPPPPPPIPGAPPAPPNGMLSAHPSMPSRPMTPEPRLNDKVLPQQYIPEPKMKMKTLNWGKIPPQKVLGKVNIWTIVASNHQDSPTADLDWSEMEGLFCLKSTQGSPVPGRANTSNGGSNAGYDTLDRKSKKENTEISLLDGKRSLNTNIFLKQFKGYNSNAEITSLIRSGQHEAIGAEKLKGLLKILPEVDEVDMLKTFNGDHQRLGSAEKFLLHLMEVPNYKLRIESMLLKEEYSANVTYLDQCITDMLAAGDSLINNKTLQEVLYMVVVAGNFLNSGGYAGNAAGVKLSSLQKLTDIRANKPNMHLIHFVAIQVEKRNPALLNFTEELTILGNASKCTSEQINNEINALDKRIQKIKRQIELPKTDEDIKDQMIEFLEHAEREVAVLQHGMKDVDNLRLKLADFFCEDPATFRLEECFKTFQSFCDKFKQAIKENERRQKMEEEAAMRHKKREEQLARRAKYANQCGGGVGTPVSDNENSFSLDGSFDPRASPALSRKRYGSFNNGSSDVNSSFIRTEAAANVGCGDGMSPDITPNGSIRRKRSRGLPEEDELMEFLRTSGHERNSRERKAAYGSLDRSWARRARSGSSSRKRPDLLNIEFGADRERAASPSPHVLQEKMSPVSPSGGETPNDETKPKISREWRQKIENWLQSNENDEKQNEEYKRKRRLVNINRRSLENDTESERKLDTLPEEKFIPTTPNHSTREHNQTFTNNTAATAAAATAAEKVNNKEHEAYKRVYPDWKPSKTLDTDVVETMQAIADDTNAREQMKKQRDKTEPKTYLISNSNTYNNPAKNDEVVLRRQRSNENASQLEAIEEEDRRRSLIQQQQQQHQHQQQQGSTERLRIYIRASSVLDKDQLNQPRNSIVEIIKTPHSAIPKTSAEPTFTIDSSIKCSSSNSTAFHSADRGNHRQETSSPATSHNNDLLQQTSKQKEIDADNIETPPVQRRIISSPTTTLVTLNRTDVKAETCIAANANASSKPLDENSEEGDFNTFNRHSLIRRTRRYKRPTDNSSGNEELSPTAKEQCEDSSKVKANETEQRTDEKTTATTNMPKSQEKSKQRPNISVKTITKLEKVGRHISSINQEDVQEAIRNLKSPTDIPERLWSPTREIICQRSNSISTDSQIKPNAITNGPTIIRVSNHELNDEGFEETQSLVSDTPSHGKESTNSSCNEASEVVPTTKMSQKSAASVSQANSSNNRNTNRTTPIQKISSRLADRLQISRLRSTSATPKPSASVTHTPATPTPAGYTTPRRTASSVDRARSIRMPNGQLLQGSASSTAAAHMSNFTNNAAIKRANSTRRTISVADSGKRGDVERSSSRNSLRSSRSSINSATSTNTVKRMPAVMHHTNKSHLQTLSVDSSPSKRPLAAQNMKGARSGGGMPASRSSSSGSSVGATNIIVVRRNNTLHPQRSVSLVGSTSFKENQTNRNQQQSASRSAVLVKTAITNNSAPPVSSVNRSASRSNLSGTRSVSSFMRPTASSATKRNK